MSNINESTPDLYELYDKLYKFSDLQELADAGVHEYLDGIRRGNWKRDEFLKAYSDIMEGIKDGTITFENGSYYDSQGRYSNASKRRKDYYGIMANYIYNIQKDLEEYNPTPKIKEVKEVVVEPESDPKVNPVVEPETYYDEARHKAFNLWVQKNGYTTGLKDDINISNASLSDIDLTGVINYLLKAPDTTIIKLFNVVADDKMTLSDLKDILDLYPGLDIDIPKIASLLLLLAAGKLKNLLQKNGDNSYYFPVLNPTQKHVWVWDDKQNTLNNISALSIPNLVLGIVNLFNQEYDLQTGNAFKDLFVTTRKKGGILKMLGGNKFTDLLQAITYSEDDLKKRYLNILGEDGKFTLSLRNSNATNNAVPDTPEYDLEEGGAELENKEHYQNWLNQLKSNESLAESWAKGYMDRQKSKPEIYQNWFDSTGKFNFNNFKNSISSIASDKKNGVGHDIIRGHVYQVEGEDGYYNALPDDYELTSKKDESNPLAYILYIKKKTQNNKVEDDDKDGKKKTSLITPQEGKEKKKFLVADVLPIALKLMDLGRVGLARQTNKKILDTLLEATKPLLLNTYNLLSPIHGDYKALKTYNKNAADKERLGELAQFNDASTYLANRAAKEIQADELREKGLLLDDAEIKRTSAESLKRTEDNIKRWTDIANANKQSMLKTAKEKASLYSLYHKENWKSIDNFLAELGDTAKTALEKQQALSRAKSLQSLAENYQNSLNKIDSDWKKKHPNGTIQEQLDDVDYKAAIRKAKRDYENQLLYFKYGV